MSRVQLALNVDDIDAAIDFYTRLFGTPPAKVREGYANFAIAQPPLKLVLIENPGSGGTLNHLGVEVETADEVVAATERLAAEGLETLVEDQTTCCYAVQDKVWVHGPDAEPWEVYTVIADAAVMHDVPAAASVDAACCGTDVAPVSLGAKPTACC
jgi:catechol 2,3-dioxygenase-like lactoylglutathione lyase family enzyme